MMPTRLRSTLYLFVFVLPVTVIGCSCESIPTDINSLCQNIRSSSDVFVARVIGANCNCIPSSDTQNSANISCVSASFSDSGQFTSEIVTRATCDAFTTSTPYGLQSCSSLVNTFEPNECPYEGQVFMDCAPLCHTTCSNADQVSPCPEVCVRGCGCPGDMVIDEKQMRCVMPSQCPNGACPVDGQIIKSCTSSCPQDCFTPANTSCVQECGAELCGCEEEGEVVDRIAGRCVQPQQCTACPIDGQVYTDCGSSCPLTCDNVNETLSCTTDCWDGCECPSGTVIDVERRKCVEPSQCGRQLPTIVERISNNNHSCEPTLVCPHNEDNHYDYCQYSVEVLQVFKGTKQVSERTIQSGPDLLSSCTNPRNYYLSVGTAYVVGIGGGCSFFDEWTPYNEFSDLHRQLLATRCFGSSASVPSLNSSILFIFMTVASYFALSL